jgi:hypothetical protein
VLGLFDRRQARVPAACAAAQLLVVIAVAATQPTSGAVSVAVAIVLAPLSVLSVAAAAARLSRGRFPSAAAIAFVLLPLFANRFVLGPYRGAFDSHALPALVGLQATGWFALGVLLVAIVAVAPERIVAAAAAAALVAALFAWSPGALGDVRPMLHESAWSVALAEWVVAATIVAAVLRRPYVGVSLGCIVVAAILRASHQPYDDAGFWRALAPLAPAGGVLLASLSLLVPTRGPEPRAASAHAPRAH